MLMCLSQGWGQLINLGVLMLGLLAFNSRGGDPYSHGSAGATYRFSFGFIAVLVAWLAYYRTWRMKPVASTGTKPVKQVDKVYPSWYILPSYVGSRLYWGWGTATDAMRQ